MIAIITKKSVSENGRNAPNMVKLSGFIAFGFKVYNGYNKNKP